MKLRTSLPAVFVSTALLMTSGCKDEKAEARIQELETKLQQIETENVRLIAEQKAEEKVRKEHLAEKDRLASAAENAWKEKLAALEAEVQRLQVVEKDAKLAEKTHQESNAAAIAEKKDATKPAKSAIMDEKGAVLPSVAHAVMIVEGDQSVGTGFVVKSNERMYLYTCAHVFSGNNRFQIKNSAGRKYTKFGTFEYAEGADLVRLEMLEDVEEYLELADENFEVALQSRIAALGNGGGTGVVSLEQGKVLGISGDMIEVDAGVIQGSSGGPVMDKATGKVLGLVTHLTLERDDIWSDGSRLGDVRRFACRLNKTWDWRKAVITTYLAEAKSLEKYDELTRVLFATATLTPTVAGLRLDTTVNGNVTAQTILMNNKDLPLVDNILRMNTQLASSSMTLSEFDLKRKFRSVIGEAISLGQRNQVAMKAEGMAWFHRSQMPASEKARTESLRMLNARYDFLK